MTATIFSLWGGHQRNTNGAPDVSAKSVDDHGLEGQHPAVGILLLLLAIFEIRLDPECGTHWRSVMNRPFRALSWMRLACCYVA